MPLNRIVTGGWGKQAVSQWWLQASRLCKCVALWIVLLAPAGAAEKWFSTSTGSLDLVSNAAPKVSLEALGQAEQLRYAVGELIGNPELAYRPPLRLLVLKQTDLPPVLREGRSRLTLPLTAGAALSPPAFRQLARQLLEQGTARLPQDFADGMVAFLSTVEVRGAHIVWGAPPAPPERTLNWARVQMLATRPEYYGKLRVILFNLSKGSAEDPAFRNAIGKSAAEFTKIAEQYLKQGQFGTADAPSRTLNAQHDLKQVPLNEEDGKLAVADLLDSKSEAKYRAMLESKSHMAEAYDGLGQLAVKRNDLTAALDNFSRAVELESKDASLWVSYARVETDRVKAGDAIEHALELDPKNADAHYLLGVRKNDPVQFELATTFAPQNAEYWDALGTAYLDQTRFSDASRAWRAAEQNAADPAFAAKMRAKWMSMESKRLDFETAEKRRTENDRRAKIDKLKAATVAQLRAAEVKANGETPIGNGPAPVPWDEVMPVEVKGIVTEVECLGARTRVTISATDNTTVKLMVKSRKGLVCGHSHLPVTTEYLKRPDEKLGTAGEVAVLNLK